MQHETQPGALGSFSPPLQNKLSPSHPAPNSSLAGVDLLGITPQNQSPPVLDRQSVTAYPRFSFLVWIIIFFFFFLTGAGLPEENISLGPIPRDLVNSSPADAQIFI